MPLSYSIDSNRQIVTITGDYTDAQGWRTLLEAVAADPSYQRGFGFIRDLRASDHPVDAETVIGIIAVVREFWDVLGVTTCRHGHAAAGRYARDDRRGARRGPARRTSRIHLVR